MGWSHPELVGETFDHGELGATDQLGMLRGDAVERAIAEPDRAIGVVVELVAPAGKHLAQGSGYRLAAALGGRAPDRLGAELGAEGAGGVVERDAGGAEAVGPHGTGEQPGQGGMVARGHHHRPAAADARRPAEVRPDLHVVAHDAAIDLPGQSPPVADPLAALGQDPSSERLLDTDAVASRCGRPRDNLALQA
jgi:hypothetical protein